MGFIECTVVIQNGLKIHFAITSLGTVVLQSCTYLISNTGNFIIKTFWIIRRQIVVIITGLAGDHGITVIFKRE